MSRTRPVERCPECGGVYRMEYIGPEDDPHGHDHGHHGYEPPPTFADFVKPEYRGTPQPLYKGEGKGKGQGQGQGKVVEVQTGS